MNAPVSIYQGLQDTTVTPANVGRWEEVFPNVVARRDYEDGAHDVQYRHWDQILVDMADMGDRIVLCQNRTSSLVAEDKASAALAAGARLGGCTWPGWRLG